MASSLRMISTHNLIVISPQPSTDHRRTAGFRRATRGGTGGGRWRAMVQEQPYLGSAGNYAKEMERLSAKESLLLAFKDAGGFQSLVGGKTTELQRIDVNERIIGLERLNPAPRPTTSPFLEGRWNFEWIGSGSPGLFAARFLFERFPVALANLVGLDMQIKDGYSKVTANLKFLNSIESKFLLTTKLSIEGPLRMKEEYVEGMFETPTVSEQAIPEQLKGTLGQVTGSLQQLPAPIKDAISNGLKIPLTEWWKSYGATAPQLAKFAIRILSLTCSARGCERNWSVFEQIHSKKRNRLETQRLNDLVFVKYNTILEERFKMGDKLDPISLVELLEDSNEWTTGTTLEEEESGAVDIDTITPIRTQENVGVAPTPTPPSAAELEADDSWLEEGRREGDVAVERGVADLEVDHAGGGGGTFQRLIMISYLDDEILIIRDSAGAPDVLTRLESYPPSLADETVSAEYES